MTKARDLANAGTALTTLSATELGYLDGVTSAAGIGTGGNGGNSNGTAPQSATGYGSGGGGASNGGQPGGAGSPGVLYVLRF